ncbi:type IV secretion system DNA-binding domain-containing protein, partial [Candidatus Parcubacteria bacterium]|nr:type IV secretion system DNA-binding domain-containing protein [Candidatus Parcubacteria bacterium]
MSTDTTRFAKTNFRGQEHVFGIKKDDRRRHMYVIGKTGMGKTTLLENMVISDIRAGNGVAVVDPHGDFAEKILNFIPSSRINDVVYFNPADIDYP